MRYLYLIGIILLAFRAPAQVNFESGSFQNLIAKASDEGKYAMVDAYTEWCGWCRTMDTETFADTAVGTFFDGQLVAAKFDMETGFGVDLAMKYRVSDYPHFLFFDGDGHLIGRLSGFKKPEDFMAAVSQVLKSENFLPPLPDPLNFDVGFPEFHRKSYLKRAERENPNPDSVITWLQSRSGLLDEATWGVVHRYVGGGVYAGEVIKFRQPLIERYGAEEVYDKLASFVFSDVKLAIKERDQSKMTQAMQLADEILDERAAAYKLRYRMYYYQMTEEWDAYAAIGREIWLTKDTNSYELLDFVANTMLKQSAPESALTEAYNWMQGLCQLQNPGFERLYTTAWLASKVGKPSDLEHYLQKAGEVGDESEIEKLRTFK